MSLKSSNNVETNVYALEIEIDAATFEAAQNKAFNKQKGKIQLPGFRKGKVTRKMAENFFGKGWLYEDALDLCFGEAVEEAVKEAGLDMVGTKTADVKEIGENGVSMTVEIFVKPDVEITEYKELKATKKKVEATDEEVDQRIEELKERNARLVSIEDRAVVDGDITVIDFEGFVDGVAFDGGKGENYELTIGSGQFIPGFEDQLIGANKGDDVTVNVTFPEDYHAEDLKGAAVEFKVKVNAIKKKELPALDDEFAKDVSEFDTFEELKNDTKAKLEKQNSDRAKAETEDKAIEAVAEKTEVEIPECMIKNQLENMLRDYDARLQGQGINLQQYFQMTGMTADSFKEQFKDHATKQVKISLTLEAIAKAEKVEASAEDVEAEYTKIAESYQMKAEDIKKFIHEDDIKDGIVNRKVVEMIVEQSK